MELIELLTEDMIKTGIESTNKREVIEELLDLMVAEHELRVIHRHQALEEIMKRETAYSTGIGCGVAMPHARLSFISEPVTAMGICRDGIDFQSIDGLPVKVVILLLTPADSHDEHLKTIANIAHLMSRKRLPSRLAGAATPNEIMEILEEEGEA